MSDEALRRRLRQLAANDDDQLSALAQERVLANVLATGPRLIRRARIERIAWRAAGATLAAAAAATLWLRIGADTLGSSGPLTKASDPANGQGHSRQSGPLPRPCESRSVPANAAFQAAGNGQALDLGKLAVRGRPNRAARRSSSRALRVGPSFVLRKGRVSVHARDLGGGELLVRARDADVSSARNGIFRFAGGRGRCGRGGRGHRGRRETRRHRRDEFQQVPEWLSPRIWWPRPR